MRADARVAWLVLIAAFVNAVLFRRRLAAIASLVIGYAASVWPPWLIGSPGHTPAAVALGLLAGLIALLSVAELSRARGQRAAAVRRSRDEQARRRASEERLVIARDLHDVVAHNISVINVQANTALHLMDRQPERARAALTAIHEVSRQALGELRSVLGVLRADDDGAPLAPSPGLDRLDELAAHARSAGIAVRLVKEGPARPLPVRLALRERPDVLLMDIRMPGLDGIEATRRIAGQATLAGVHVVILTTFELDEYIFDGLRAGAAGFLVKDTDAAELIRAVRVATGLSNEEIARQIYVSLSTVKTHATRAMAKLGARDRAQLVVFAYQAGLVRPGWA